MNMSVNTASYKPLIPLRPAALASAQEGSRSPSVFLPASLREAFQAGLPASLREAFQAGARAYSLVGNPCQMRGKWNRYRMENIRTQISNSQPSTALGEETGEVGGIRIQ
jgi:hypothetical protein